jgi:hypothetical protein
MIATLHSVNKQIPRLKISAKKISRSKNQPAKLLLLEKLSRELLFASDQNLQHVSATGDT